MTSHLRYSADIESYEADEPDTIQGIIDSVPHQIVRVWERNQHAVRASHADSNAADFSEWPIADALPPELAQACSRSPACIPRVDPPRQGNPIGGVAGDKLPARDPDILNFVLATGLSGTASGFRRNAKQVGAATPVSADGKSAGSSLARNRNALLSKVAALSAKADFSAIRSAISAMTINPASRRYGMNLRPVHSRPAYRPRRWPARGDEHIIATSSPRSPSSRDHFASSPRANRYYAARFRLCVRDVMDRDRPVARRQYRQGG